MQSRATTAISTLFRSAKLNGLRGGREGVDFGCGGTTGAGSGLFASRPNILRMSATRVVSMGCSVILRQLTPAKTNRSAGGIELPSIMYGKTEFFDFSLKAKVSSALVNFEA